jgi:hypothetical protein
MSKNLAEISARATRANTLREISKKLMIIKARDEPLKIEDIEKFVEELDKEADELTKI